jgi:hypothetical protein
MFFEVVRIKDADNRFVRRSRLPPTITTRKQATAALEKDLETYEDHGYEPQQGHWWARDKDGEQYTFWVEDLPQPMPGASKSLPH